MVVLPNGKSQQLTLDWDPSSSTLSTLLYDLGFPTILTFGVGSKLPDAKEKSGFFFPTRRIGASGDDESSSDEEDQDKHSRVRRQVARFAAKVTTVLFLLL